MQENVWRQRNISLNVCMAGTDNTGKVQQEQQYEM